MVTKESGKELSMVFELQSLCGRLTEAREMFEDDAILFEGA